MAYGAVRRRRRRLVVGSGGGGVGDGGVGDGGVGGGGVRGGVDVARVDVVLSVLHRPRRAVTPDDRLEPRAERGVAHRRREVTEQRGLETGVAGALELVRPQAPSRREPLVLGGRRWAVLHFDAPIRSDDPSAARAAP